MRIRTEPSDEKIESRSKKDDDAEQAVEPKLKKEDEVVELSTEGAELEVSNLTEEVALQWMEKNVLSEKTHLEVIMQPVVADPISIIPRNLGTEFLGAPNLRRSRVATLPCYNLREVRQH